MENNAVNQTPATEPAPAAQAPAQEVDVSQNPAVQALLAQERDRISRQLQSAKDKEVALLRRDYEQRVRQAEASAVTSGLSLPASVDDDVKLQLENAQARKIAAYYQQREEAERKRQEAAEYGRRVKESLTSHLADLGIEPTDARVDWADNESDPIIGQQKWHSSIARILSDKRAQQEKALTEKIEATKRELRKELGLDSVDSSVGAAGMKPVFTEEQIADRTFWEKNKEAILQAQADGRIKKE